MRSRRSIAAGALLLGAAGLLAACAGGGDAGTAAVDLSEPEEKEGTLVVLERWPEPEYAPYFEGVVQRYMEENPGVEIELQAVGNQPYKDKLQVLASSDQLPDVYFAWPGEYTNKFVRAGMAADLSSVLAPGTEWGDSLSSAAVDAYSLDGKQYGVPFRSFGKFMYYSKEAFAAAGVEEPATLDDLIASCAPLRAAGYTPVGFANQFGWPAIHYLTQLNAHEVPADVLAADYAPDGGAYDDPGYVAALEQLQRLNEECFTPDANAIAYEAEQAAFAQGKSAMYYMDNAEYPRITDDPANLDADWGWFALPSSADAAGPENAIAGAPDGFLVNPKGNAALAVDFLKFMTNEANAQALVQDLGWTSPTAGSMTEENSYPVNREMAEVLDDSTFAIWLDTVTPARVADAYLSGVQALLDGSASPDEVMSSVREAAEKAREESE